MSTWTTMVTGCNRTRHMTMFPRQTPCLCVRLTPPLECQTRENAGEHTRLYRVWLLLLVYRYCRYETQHWSALGWLQLVCVAGWLPTGNPVCVHRLFANTLTHTHKLNPAETGPEAVGSCPTKTLKERSLCGFPLKDIWYSRSLILLATNLLRQLERLLFC